MDIIFILLLALIPASFPFEPFPARVAQAKEVSINDLRKSPTRIVLDGKSLSLSAYLWRDFMPSVPSMIDGKPMIAVFKVATSDKKSFPSGIRIERAWVLFGEQMWETSDFREQLGGPTNNKDSSEKWINCNRQGRAAPFASGTEAVCSANRLGSDWRLAAAAVHALLQHRQKHYI